MSVFDPLRTVIQLAQVQAHGAGAIMKAGTRKLGRALSKWIAIIVLLAGFAFSLCVAAYGYLWGANPWALPLVVFMAMIVPATVAGLVFVIGWAIFVDPPNAA